MITFSRNVEKQVTTFNNLQAEVEMLRKNNKEMLRNLARFLSMVKITPSGILVADEEKKIVLANQAFCDIFSITAAPEKLVGIDCTETATVNMHLLADPESFPRRIKEILASRSPVIAEEILFADGTAYERDYIPVFSEDNSFIGHMWQYRDITRHKAAEGNLKKRDQLLQLINRLGNSFINIPEGSINQYINEALKEIGLFINVDRVYLFSHDFAQKVTTNTHEWSAKGVSPQKDNLQALPFGMFPEILKKQIKGETIYYPRVSDLPPDDPARKFFENEGTQSVVMIPTMHGDKCLGFVGFDAVKSKRNFSEIEINLLKIVAELLTNAKLKRQKEQLLRAKEEEIAYHNKLLEALFKNSTDAIVAFDENNKITDINSNFRKLFGYELKDIRGLDIDDALEIGRSKSTNRSYTKTVLTGRKIVAEGTRYNKEGSPVEVLIKGIPVAIGNKFCGGYGIYTDITERKRADETLRKSEEKYREILMTMEEGYYEVDLKGNLVFFNDSMSRILGYSKPELLKLRYDDYHKDPDSVFKIYNKVYNTGIADKIAGWTIITGDGQEKHIEVSVSLKRNDQGETVGFRGIARDITERIEAEEALRESEDKYRDILSSIEDGYFEVDLKGNITFCNEASARMLGYTVDEFLNLNYRDITINHQLFFNTFNRVFRTGQTNHALTFEMTKKDGSSAYAELSVSLVRDKGGNICGFRGIGRDVTERKNYEDQLKYLSMHDQLTGLFNRSYFENELVRLSSSREYPISIVSIDLDGLKLVNDTIGHQQGDQLLVACANLLKKTVRGEDVLARVGGDEFVILLPQTDSKAAESVIRRFGQQVDIYNNETKEQIPLSISLGMATAENKDANLHEAFKEADDLMYRDKLHKGVDARSQIIRSLMITLGERDFITQGHARRLEELSKKLGKKVGLSKKALSDLALLAQGHDLGKVGVPDSILFKEGSLTDEQWQIIKQHPEKGYRIASSSNDLSGIADLILKHHERWDGTGYPLGISGEDIPVECRIIAIVDAFDAMTNDRPYRKAISHKKAEAELINNAGTQFDPKLVEAFLKILKQQNDNPEK